MIKINKVTAPADVSVGVKFELVIGYDSTSSSDAQLSIEPTNELEIDPVTTTLPGAPGGGSVAVNVTILPKEGCSTKEARILVDAGTTRSTFTRLT